MSFANLLKVLTLILVGTSLATGAVAQTQYPDRPVKMLVGYAPGGATDIIARLVGTHLHGAWGQPVVVENKPGAGGMLAGEQVARAAPDGYTLLLGYTPEVSINKLVYKSMRYDPIEDLTPIALTAAAPLVLVAGPKLPVADFKALMAHKNDSRKISFGSPGLGGQQHMAGEMLGKLTGLPLLHVPYRGTALAVGDLVGGQIDLFFATAPALLPHIKAGKLKPLLVASDKRESLLPDVPSAVELGLPSLQLTNWFGVFGPRSLSPAVRAKIADGTVAAMKAPAVVKQLQDQGLTPQPLTGQEFRKFIDSEMERYKTIVEQTGIRVE